MLDLGCGVRLALRLRGRVSRGAEGGPWDRSQQPDDRGGREALRRSRRSLTGSCALEEYDYPEAAWDCVVSNLALHYIADLDEIFRKVFRTLKPGGTFLFNMEHPVFTAGVGQEWICGRRRKASVLACGRLFLSGENAENELSWLSGHETAPYT